MVNTSFINPTFSYQSIEEAFPDIEPCLRPYGSRVLVQLAMAKKETAGGILLPDEARETIQWNQQIAKVRFLGPVAFKNRDTLKPWPEGDWAQVGTFVRVPKHGGDRWQIEVAPKSDDHALFVIFNDLDLLGHVPDGMDPMRIKAFI